MTRHKTPSNLLTYSSLFCRKRHCFTVSAVVVHALLFVDGTTPPCLAGQDTASRAERHVFGSQPLLLGSQPAALHGLGLAEVDVDAKTHRPCVSLTGHWSCGVVVTADTFRASLSGNFLQTLPGLVTPLKGHSLSPRSCPPTRSVPFERFGYQYDCGKSQAPKHPRKHETHPHRVKEKKKKEEVPFRLKRL